MPLVGGGRELIVPFEYDSFESAMSDIETAHKFGIAFDYPVPVDAVEWKVVLYSHYDYSRRAITKDVDWNTAKLYWMAALGLISEVKFYLDVHIKQRLKFCDVKLPSEYSINDCIEYNYIHPKELLDKHGDVDRFASMF